MDWSLVIWSISICEGRDGLLSIVSPTSESQGRNQKQILSPGSLPSPGWGSLHLFPRDHSSLCIYRALMVPSLVSSPLLMIWVVVFNCDYILESSEELLQKSLAPIPDQLYQNLWEEGPSAKILENLYFFISTTWDTISVPTLLVWNKVLDLFQIRCNVSFN